MRNKKKKTQTLKKKTCCFHAKFLVRKSQRSNQAEKRYTAQSTFQNVIRHMSFFNLERGKQIFKVWSDKEGMISLTSFGNFINISLQRCTHFTAF